MLVEQCFLDDILSNPQDLTPRLVYADWLEEQGDPRGELLRIQEELRNSSVPGRTELEARMHQLLAHGVKPLAPTCKNSLGIKMVLIFPGEYRVGPRQWRIAVDEAFWLSKFPVTRAQFRRLMRSDPSGFVGGDLRAPADSIAWSTAVGFCNALNRREGLSDFHRSDLVRGRGNGYRLPSEDEWELACRAGTTTQWHFGQNMNQLTHYAWFADNSERQTHPVGHKRPNAWGLFDLYGNVWELVWNRDDRRMCGGAWNSAYPYRGFCHQNYNNPLYAAPSIGFRLARSFE